MAMLVLHVKSVPLYPKAADTLCNIPRNVEIAPCASTSEIVARNIARNAARVEASSTSATLHEP